MYFMYRYIDIYIYLENIDVFYAQIYEKTDILNVEMELFQWGM